MYTAFWPIVGPNCSTPPPAVLERACSSAAAQQHKYIIVMVPTVCGVLRVLLEKCHLTCHFALRAPTYYRQTGLLCVAGTTVNTSAVFFFVFFSLWVKPEKTSIWCARLHFDLFFFGASIEYIERPHDPRRQQQLIVSYLRWLCGSPLVVMSTFVSICS